MDAFSQYKFPNKVRKFNIAKPSLMIFISKYENHIPWNSGINSESSIENYISSVLLPELYKACNIKTTKNLKKSYFIEPCHVTLNSHADGIPTYNQVEIKHLNELLQNQNESAAKGYLASIVNTRKNKAFNSWINTLKKGYSQDPAFIYMMLRSVFDTTPYGSRRVLAAPDIDVIEWLHLKINRRVFNPQDSLSKSYFLKKSFGNGKNIQNGWQYVSMGVHNASKLSAAARGSGWCIASGYAAKLYLEDFSFYILRRFGKPVVALRVNAGTVFECVGVHNSVPSQFAHDIKLYSDYMNFVFDDPLAEDYLKEISFADFSADWWEQRIILWPGSYYKMDDQLKNKVTPPSLDNFIQYIDFITLERLEKDFKLVFNVDALVKILTVSPHLFASICRLHQNESNIEQLKSGCIEGWLIKIENGELTLNEYKKLPDFVKESEEYIHLLKKQIATNLYKELYKVPKTLLSRTNRAYVDDFLAYNELEEYTLTVKRVTTIILNEESSDFSDDIFPDEIKSRGDFNTLRQDAWMEAISARPSYRLALPPDLSILPEFEFDKSSIDTLTLQNAIDAITEKPWLLDSVGKMYVKVRQREEALKAYIKGWKRLILKNPSRLWCVTNRSYGRREYITYAALRNKQIIDAYFLGFREAINKNSDVWEKLSPRTQDIPVIKMAFLIALHNSWNEKLQKKYFGPNSSLKKSLSTDAVSQLNAKIIEMRAYFCYQNFINNCLGPGLEFSYFSDC